MDLNTHKPVRFVCRELMRVIHALSGDVLATWPGRIGALTKTADFDLTLTNC